MSEVWKCDKCQRVFEKGGQETRYYAETRKFADMSRRSQTIIDLCSDCKKKLDKWFEDKPYSHYFGSDFTFKVMGDGVYWPAVCEKTPRVYFGSVHPFPTSNLDDKEFPKKMLEEAAEVYSAWEDYAEAVAKDDDEEAMECLRHIAYECGDVIQTCANMLHAVQKAKQESSPLLNKINVYDAQSLMKEIEKRNRERGRYDE